MLVPIRQLGAVGLVSPEDAPSVDLPPHAFTEVDSAVFRDKWVRKTQGYEILFAGFTEDALWFESWISEVAGVEILSIAFGMASKIFATTDGQYVSQCALLNQAGALLGVAPGTMTTSVTGWQSEVYGKFCIMNNGADMPMYSSAYSSGPPSQWTFRQIPGWAVGTAPTGAVNCIRAAYNHLVALGVVNYPYTVFVSARGTPETFPTDWDPATVGGTARSFPVQSRDGPVIDGGMLNGRFIIYQRYACSAMDYIGGSYIFSLTRLLDSGLINRDAWIQFENWHLVVGEHEIVMHDGSSIKRPDDNTIRKRFYGELDDATSVRCALDNVNHEAIIYYNNDRMLIYSYLENTWSFEELDSEVQRIASAVTPGEPLTWADLTMPWSDISFSWASMNSIDRTTKLCQLHPRSLNLRNSGYRRVGTDPSFALELTDIILVDGVAGSGDRLILEYPEQAEYDAYAMRNYIDLDEITGDAVNIKRVDDVFPQIKGQGLCDIQFGISDSPRDDIRWSPKQTIDFDSDQRRVRVYLRMAGRYLHWRIGSWNGALNPGWWAMSGMDVNLNIEGPR